MYTKKGCVIISKKGETINIKIDAELKRNFKICTAKNDDKMTDIIIKAIEEYVNKNRC